MDKPRILVVEDDAAIRTGICDLLAFCGYAPEGVADGRQGLSAALRGSYALLILDVMLPEVDGLQICAQARQTHPQQAILMLTARGDEASILEGFRLGADDYVTKPFSVAQLAARVRALMRRATETPLRRFSVGSLEVDADRQLALAPDGSAVALSVRDIEVLAYFAARPGVVVGRDALLREIWGYARVDQVHTRCVDMHIAKLRRKLSALAAQEVIATVRGSGYRLQAVES